MRSMANFQFQRVQITITFMRCSYRSNNINVSFSWHCPVVDNEFCHDIAKVVGESTRRIQIYFDNVMTKFMIGTGQRQGSK